MGLGRAAFITAITPTLLCVVPKVLSIATRLSSGASRIGNGGVSNHWVIDGVWMNVGVLECLITTTFLGLFLAMVAEVAGPSGDGW